jgi:hypothetical protein
LYRRLRGHTRPVTDQEYDEQTHPETDDLLGGQEGDDENDQGEPSSDE